MALLFVFKSHDCLCKVKVTFDALSLYFIVIWIEFLVELGLFLEVAHCLLYLSLIISTHSYFHLQFRLEVLDSFKNAFCFILLLSFTHLAKF